MLNDNINKRIPSHTRVLSFIKRCGNCLLLAAKEPAEHLRLLTGYAGKMLRGTPPGNTSGKNQEFQNSSSWGWGGFIH